VLSPLAGPRASVLKNSSIPKNQSCQSINLTNPSPHFGLRQMAQSLMLGVSRYLVEFHGVNGIPERHWNSCMGDVGDFIVEWNTFHLEVSEGPSEIKVADEDKTR
jgi:hypothetical protein